MVSKYFVSRFFFLFQFCLIMFSLSLGVGLDGFPLFLCSMISFMDSFWLTVFGFLNSSWFIVFGGIIGSFFKTKTFCFCLVRWNNFVVLLAFVWQFSCNSYHRWDVLEHFFSIFAMLTIAWLGHGYNHCSRN